MQNVTINLSTLLNSSCRGLDYKNFNIPDGVIVVFITKIPRTLILQVNYFVHITLLLAIELYSKLHKCSFHCKSNFYCSKISIRNRHLGKTV